MNKEYEFSDELENVENIDDLNVLKELANEFELEQQDPNYNLGYEMGYNTGFIEGYEQGQSSLSLEKESAIYNEALTDVMNHVNSFDFVQKNDLMQVLRLLQRI
jgi:flagellar biosynthesis/type III secretory pathway protein FliH